MGLGKSTPQDTHCSKTDKQIQALGMLQPDVPCELDVASVIEGLGSGKMDGMCPLASGCSYEKWPNNSIAPLKYSCVRRTMPFISGKHSPAQSLSP